jgi:hypothetical protein
MYLIALHNQQYTICDYHAPKCHNRTLFREQFESVLIACSDLFREFPSASDKYSYKFCGGIDFILKINRFKLSGVILLCVGPQFSRFKMLSSSNSSDVITWLNIILNSSSDKALKEGRRSIAKWIMFNDDVLYYLNKERETQQSETGLRHSQRHSLR